MRSTFDLAPMSPTIRWLTILLCLLPPAFAFAALAGARALWLPASLLLLLYAVVWLCARPRRFEAAAGSLDVVFPTWRRSVNDVEGARLVTTRELTDRYGWMLRVGVGGLWGGFGWLWTSRGGWIEFYISRTDGFVLVERRQGRPVLVTPDDAHGLAAAIAQRA